MSYTLHLHPLSSFCWKVMIAFDEAGVAYEAVTVDLGDPEKVQAYRAVSPLAKIPALVDHVRGVSVIETPIIIEHLACHEATARHLVPTDYIAAARVRWLDRMFDLYVQVNMQKIALDSLRPADARDPWGVDKARQDLDTALGLLDREIPAAGWAAGDTLTMADCAAAPALYYANEVAPFEATRPNLWAYFCRLRERPSFVRALAGAQPYMMNFPPNRKAAQTS